MKPRQACLAAGGALWLAVAATPACAAGPGPGAATRVEGPAGPVVAAAAEPAAGAMDAAAPGAALALLLAPERVAQVLSQAPAYRAALSEIDVARAQQRQWSAGDPAWTATLETLRRNEAGAMPASNHEWTLGLQRSLRLPGKAPAYEGAGRARLNQAQAAVQRAWREQSRELLETLGGWLRAAEAARQWARQVELLGEQRDAVARRQRLGAAAVLERHQADAALAQARARADAATEHAMAAREALARRFPGLEPQGTPLLPTPQPLPDADAAWLARLQAANSELAAAREAVAVAAAQGRIDRAEQQPDPSVALRVGRARSGGEQVLGLSISLPFGGDARDAVASAAAARATAAVRLQEDAERLALAGATQHLRAARAAHASWLGQAEAARHMNTAADGVARAFQLGEGTLAEVLAARRLANEQGLEAALAGVDAWLLRSRLELEAGLLWPAALPAAGSAAP
jgi:outer membrane protein TolC